MKSQSQHFNPRTALRRYGVRPAMWLAVSGLIFCAGCARIEPETFPAVEAFDRMEAGGGGASSPVFVSSDYLVKKRTDPKLAAYLVECLGSRLREQGFEVTEDERKAASKINCTVSTWPGYGGNTDKVALMTLGMYTPFHYPWTVEAEMMDGAGGKIGSVREKGQFHFFSIGTILLHIPTAIVFATAVPAKRRELADDAAKMVVVALRGKAAPAGTQAAKVTER